MRRMALFSITTSIIIFLSISAYKLPTPSLDKGLAMNVSKVVIPAAGYGTRFLPITKSIPKEMLPVLNKPALQLVIEECAQAGIEESCLIVTKEKHEIRDYFTPQPHYRSLLKAAGKEHYLQGLTELLDRMKFTYINQDQMRGLGHAILLSKEAVGNEMFAVWLPDMLLMQDKPCLQPLVQAAQEHQATIVAVMEVPNEEISSYGSIKVGTRFSENLMEITDIIEKPKPENAYSNYAIFGIYIFTPEIYDAIQEIAPHAQGEIQLTDAIALLARRGKKVYAYKVSGTMFDLGRPGGWLAANVYEGLRSPQYCETIRGLLKNML